MAADGFLGFECDELIRWFSRVYPQYKMRVHYKWKKPDHHYYFEIEKGTDRQVLPLIVPDAWFQDPEMEAAIRDNFLVRLQQKTIQAVG